MSTNDRVALFLRNVFTIILVPMVNADGVIVGNYRNSLSGKDLNRTFKTESTSYPEVLFL